MTGAPLLGASSSPPEIQRHYFPAAEDLVAAAFALAVTGEREKLMPADGTPLERVARFVERVESGVADELASLWLNARHLSRFSPPLRSVIEAQEELDRSRLVALINDGNATGDFDAEDALAACVRIFISVDGYGAYANNTGSFEHPAYEHFVLEAVARELKVPLERLLVEAASLPSSAD